MKLPSIPQEKALSFLRILTGFIFVSHGLARLWYNSLNDFGGFLNSKGFMIGTVLAWGITLGEIIGGFLLAVGLKVKYVILFHLLIIVSGIILVHLQNGWFVVGHGESGIEYSLLLLAVLIVLYSSAGE